MRRSLEYFLGVCQPSSSEVETAPRDEGGGGSDGDDKEKAFLTKSKMNTYFSSSSQSSPSRSLNDELESCLDSFLLSLIESHHLTLTENSFFLPATTQNEVATTDSSGGNNSAEENDDIDDDNDYDDNLGSVDNDDDDDHMCCQSSAILASHVGGAAAISQPTHCYFSTSDAGESSAFQSERKKRNNSMRMNDRLDEDGACGTDDVSVVNQTLSQTPLHPTAESTHTRVTTALLCFVSLPSSRSLCCFTPSFDTSDIDVQTKPLIELEQLRFFFLRFRSKYWVGVVSTASTRTARRLTILDLVRRRKCRTIGPSLVSSASVPALLYSPSSTSHQHPLVRTPVRHQSWDSGSPVVGSTARYRECHAMLDVMSGEILGIAPCQPMPMLHPRQQDHFLEQQNHKHRRFARCILPPTSAPSSPSSSFDEEEDHRDAASLFPSPSTPLSVPMLLNDGYTLEQFDIKEAVDGWLLAATTKT